MEAERQSFHVGLGVGLFGFAGGAVISLLLYLYPAMPRGIPFAFLGVFVILMGAGAIMIFAPHRSIAWTQAARRRKLLTGPFILMAVGVIAFLVGVAWASWPTNPEQSTTETIREDTDQLKVYVKCEDMFWNYLDGQTNPDSPVNVYIIGRNDGLAEDGIGVGHIRPNHYKEFRELQEKYYKPYSASLIKCTMKFFSQKAFYGVRATVPFDLYNVEKIGSENYKPTTLYRKDSFGLRIEDVNNDKDVFTFIVFVTEMSKFVRLDFPGNVVYKDLGSDQYKQALVTANFMDAPFIDFLGAFKMN